MRLCNINDLRPGMKVARDVCDDRLELVVAAGLQLDLHMITRLEVLEIEDIYIDEPGTEDIIPSDMISDKRRRETHRLLKRTFDDLMNIAEMRDIASEDVANVLQYDDRYANAVKVNSFREIIHATVEELFVLKVETFETPLVKLYLNRSYEHALNVTILSLLIGRAFGYSHNELLALGTAAMLHDVGKLLFPEIVNKSLAELSPYQKRRLKVHPEAGALLLSRTDTKTNLEEATIRQHHEQQDGRGYPGKLTGQNDPPVRTRQHHAHEIYRMAEILQVANSFDNLINGDLVVGPMTPAEAMETIVRGAGSIYNRAVVSKALELINVYPTGAIVELKVGALNYPRGSRGVVRKNTASSYSRPEILMVWDNRGNRLPPRILDLNKFPGVDIELV